MILIILFKKKLINKHKMLLLRMLNKIFKKEINRMFKMVLKRTFKKEIKIERTRRVLKALCNRANKIL